MQSEDARMHVLIPRETQLFKQFCRNFIKKEALDDTSISSLNLSDNHLEVEQICCGTEVEIYCHQAKLSESDLVPFKQSVKKFYIKFCQDLRKRINFNDVTLNFLPKFSPKNVISGATNSILPIITEIFPEKELINAAKINSEFRALADYAEVKSKKELPICEFWAEVASFKNELGEYMFGNISRIVQRILSIPHSSANVERIFSIQNLIKTKCRNRLHVKTCSCLIQTKDLIKSECCYGYNITKELIKKNLSNELLPSEEVLN